jgi:hypothetical protein
MLYVVDDVVIYSNGDGDDLSRNYDSSFAVACFDRAKSDLALEGKAKQSLVSEACLVEDSIQLLLQSLVSPNLPPNLECFRRLGFASKPVEIARKLVRG